MNNQIFFGFLNLVIALFATIKITPGLIVFGRKFNLIDKSDKRKRNRANMVRIGGVAIFLGFFVSQIIWFCFYFSFNSFEIEFESFLKMLCTQTPDRPPLRLLC